MKRSMSVSAGLLASLALSLTGCGSNNAHRDQARRCVNDQNVVVDDSNCNGSGTGTNHWYYGGNGYSRGMTATGGSPYQSSTGSKSSIYNDGSVSRGGIGGTSGGGGHGSSGS